MTAVAAMYLFLIPCAALFIRAKQKGDSVMSLIFKTASTVTVLLAGIYFSHNTAGNLAAYAMFVTAGLALGLAGDVAICAKFIWGMIFFALGHFAYIAAILRVNERPLRAVAVFAVLAAIILVLYAVNRAKLVLGGLAVPAAIYCVIILAMLSLALTGGHFVLSTGAVLFTASDAMLALNKFHSDIGDGIDNADRFNHRPDPEHGFYRALDAISLCCYYAGQSLFAISILTMN
jgi:uncharacterized membrane protein YhhN